MFVGELPLKPCMSWEQLLQHGLASFNCFQHLQLADCLVLGPAIDKG